jgi:malonyl-CoA decarboxylase
MGARSCAGTPVPEAGMVKHWFDALLSSIADRGRAWIKIPTDLPPLEQAKTLATSLLSEKGEASGAALARALIDLYRSLSAADKSGFLLFLAENFTPDAEALRDAAEQYLAQPSAEAAARLAEVAEPPRQELLRRINMGALGTATLVGIRETLQPALRTDPHLAPLDVDLKHLFASWFNRGFLELRRIDWHTPASTLEKLIAYEAVHEIKGWADLRRRLAPDRRCFAFFHPALRDEPLIFVEVALVNGLASAIEPLLAAEDPSATIGTPDTAIFYSISNCQRGLRGISFGNFLIKQVVEDLKHELPSLTRFSTLSPVPGFRAWLESRPPAEPSPDSEGQGEDGNGETPLTQLLADPSWTADPIAAAAVEPPLLRLCALYLTENKDGKGPSDSVARFHLGNGARLERVNFLANPSPRGQKESYGVMVNYLYDLEKIEANHEAFVRHGRVARSPGVDDLLREQRSAAGTVGSLLGFGGKRSRPPTTRPREAAQ